MLVRSCFTPWLMLARFRSSGAPGLVLAAPFGREGHREDGIARLPVYLGRENAALTCVSLVNDAARRKDYISLPIASTAAVILDRHDGGPH